MLVKSKEINNQLERKIIIGMIMNDDFCGRVIEIFQSNFFSTDYIQIIAEWIKNYFEKYRQSPKKMIKEIFENEKSNFDRPLVLEIKNFLLDLSNEFEKESSFNVEYLWDKTLEYFKFRKIQNLSESINSNLAMGRLDKIENLLNDFKKSSSVFSNWRNPFSEKEVGRVFLLEETNQIFCFPGDLGRLIGYMEREWFVAFMGSMKRGKSWWLMEMAVQAYLMRLKVVIISLEMLDYKYESRLYKRLTGYSMRKGKVLVPIFDCKKNQEGNCIYRNQKFNKQSVVDMNGDLLEFDESIKHKICTYCLEDEERRKEFLPSIWYKIHNQEKDLDSKTVILRNKKTKNMFGDNIRIISYPAYSAGWTEIERDLDVLGEKEGFVPDMILIDYLDILKKESNDPLENIDIIWKKGKKISSERHCILGTVTQTTRAGISKLNLEEEDTPGDIRKLAHVELMLTINQTAEEKKKGLWRIGIMARRHGEFSKLEQVLVLHSLDLGQPLLDSIKISRRENKNF